MCCVFSFVLKRQQQHQSETKGSIHSLSSNLQSVVSRVQVFSTTSLLKPHHVQYMKERSLTQCSGLKSSTYWDEMKDSARRIETHYQPYRMEYHLVLWSCTLPMQWFWPNSSSVINSMLHKFDHYNHRSRMLCRLFLPHFHTRSHLVKGRSPETNL